MKDENETKEQLMNELVELRQRIAELEKSETEHKKAEEVLKVSEEKFRLLFSTEQDAVIIVDGETRKIMDANDSALCLYGYSREEILKLKGPDLSAEPEKSDAAIRRITMEPDKKIYYHTRNHKKKDGTVFPVEISSGTFMLKDRKIISAVIRDITERKLMEEALRENEEKYHAFFEQAADSIVLIDVDTGALAEFNNMACENLGYTREEFQKLKIPDFEVIESAEDVAEHIKKIIKKGADVFETKHRRKSGEMRDILVSSRAISVGRKDFIQSIWSDITEHKQIEKALRKARDELEMRVKERTFELEETNKGLFLEIDKHKKTQEKLKESEERLRDLYDNAPDMYYSLDKNGIIINCNETLVKTLGYTKKEIIGKPLTDFYTAASKNLYKQTIVELTKGKRLTNLMMREFVRKDGTVLPVNLNVFVELDEKGKLIGTRAIARDVTERKKAEEKLKQSEEHLNLAQETADVGSWDWNLEENTLTWSDNTFHQFGLKPNEITPTYKEFEKFVHPEQLKLVNHAVKQAVEGKKDYSIDIQVTSKGGREWIMHAQGIVYRNKKGKPIRFIGTQQDITERKKAEKKLTDAYQKLKETQEQLIQSDKMAAMGQLSAGISHELNQPLTGIKGFAQTVLMELDENSSFKKDLQRIVEQADRMDKIIKHVRFFAKKSDFQIKRLDINQPIEDSLTLLTQQLKTHNILINKSPGKNLPMIEGDSNQLEQVFLNLTTNARDAIDSLKSPDGGGITITTALSNNKKHIEVIFKDTGCGISKENLNNIFNPFFTTKSPDGGIGLGLSIVYRIIESHKGSIEVDSKEGKGTTFKIILPVA